GYGMSQLLTYLFNPLGTVLVLLTLMLTGVTLLTGFSWLYQSKQLGNFMMKFFTFLKHKTPDFQDFFSKEAVESDSPPQIRIPNVLKNSHPQVITPPSIPYVQPKSPTVVMPKVPEKKSSVPIKTHLSFDLLDASHPQQNKGYSQKQLTQMSSLVEL